MRRSISALLLVPAAVLLAQSNDLAAKSKRAKELMAAGRFADAVPLYAELVESVPNNPGLLLNLGMARHMAGRYRDAIPPLAAAVKLEPAIFPAWLFIGASHYELKQPAEAVPALRKALDLEPGHRDARRMLADSLFILGRYEQAAGEYRRLTDADASDAKTWYSLGRSYEALARRAFENLAASAPESGWALALLAEARAAADQHSAAFHLYRKVAGISPKMRGVHKALAAIYAQTGHADWAAIEEEKERRLGAPDCRAEKLACDFAAGEYLRVAAAARPAMTQASLYWQSRAYNELARQAWSRLAQLPVSAEIQRLTAEIHGSQGRHVEAVKYWREALKLAPGDPGLERGLASSLHASRDDKAAEALLRKLLRAEPNSVELNFLLGDALLGLQRAEEAVPYLEKAVARESGLLPARASLARAYLQTGRADRAVPHLKAALPVDDDGSLHYQLARAYQSSGQADAARELLKKYQVLQKASETRRAAGGDVRITAPAP